MNLFNFYNSKRKFYTFNSFKNSHIAIFGENTRTPKISINDPFPLNQAFD